MTGRTFGPLPKPPPDFGKETDMSKVLIVDDNGPIRDFLKIHFEGRDHEFITAEDGKEALAKAESEGPNLIVLDMNIPVMTACSTRWSVS